MEIGKLAPVDLKQLWAHEELEFTPWLEGHLDVLGDAIGLSLTPVGREMAVGLFQVDLVAEDDERRTVVIEAQLMPTDHDHLGKLLTYVTNLEAKVAIWICREARPEHARAVAWLNEMSPEDMGFYLVRVAAYCIGESAPAPLFTLIVGPSAEAKGVGVQKKKLGESHYLRQRFWAQLLERARNRGVMVHANVTPTTDNWLNAGAGKSGLAFSYLVWLKGKTAVELYINTGDYERNKAIFERLQAKREAIEGEFGSPLEWKQPDEKLTCHIRYTIEGDGIGEGEERWPVIQDAMVDAMERLAKTVKPYIAEL